MKKHYIILLVSIQCIAKNFAFAQPTITNFTPTSGPIGTVVTITGTNFSTTPADNIVFFGATGATVNTATATSLDVTVPAGAAYQYISVTNLTTHLTAYSLQPFTVTFSCGGALNLNSFAPKISYTLNKPFSVGIGDLDGDGKSDLAVGSNGSSNISVLRNTTNTIGTISFAAKQDFAAGLPFSVGIGDLDGDGKPDLAIPNYNASYISALLNTSTVGNISFAAKIDFSTGYQPRSMSINDLDGDGKPDLVIATQDFGYISVLRNTSTIGVISFAAKVEYYSGDGTVSTIIHDFDGDNKPDIAVASGGSGWVSIFRNTSTKGAISFAPKAEITALNAYRLVTGDFDGDGKSDIACIQAWNDITILRNTSTSGAISFFKEPNFTLGNDLRDVSIGDLDGDGKPDLAFAQDNTTALTISKNISTVGNISFAPNFNVIAGTGSLAATIGDLDSDGKPDIVTADNTDGKVSVFRNLSGAIATMTSTSTATICGGDTLKIPLTSDIPATYTWLASDNPNTIGESLTMQAKDTLRDIITNTTQSVQTITYTVVPTSVVSSCAGPSQIITVTINPPPISDAGNDLTICSGVAGSIGALAVAGNTYLWTPATGLSDATISNPNNTTVNNGSSPIVTTYTVTTKITATGCQSTDQTIITVNPQPVLTISNPVAECFPTTVDIGATGITAGSTGGGSLSYWTDAGATDSLLFFNAVALSGTYYIKVTAAGGCIDIKPVTVTINPLPVVSFSGLDTSYCNNVSAQTLVGSPAGGIFSGAGISGNLFTASVATPGIHTITYTYTDTNSCTNTSSRITEVLPLPEAPTICMVTADSLSQNNIIIWEKTGYTQVDSFIVYREISTNNYKRIGAVPFDSLSEFVDTVRTKYFPNTGNPNAGTYRYKLQIRDTCGNYSPMSPYHNTIFITNNGGVFSWAQLYTIEGAVNPVNSYVLMRDDNNDGNWLAVNSVSGTQQTVTDPSYATFQSSASWRVETFWSISCTPTRTFSTSLSNKRTNSVVSVSFLSLKSSVKVYPTVNNGEFIVETGEKDKLKIEIYSVLGELVYSSELTNAKTIIQMPTLNKGVYMIHLIADKEVSTHRIILN